jgi:hypothetical protein
MANATATLYIRSKPGLSKAPKKPVELPEGSTYYLYWYENAPSGRPRMSDDMPTLLSARCPGVTMRMWIELES